MLTAGDIDSSVEKTDEIRPVALGAPGTGVGVGALRESRGSKEREGRRREEQESLEPSGGFKLEHMESTRARRGCVKSRAENGEGPEETRDLVEALGAPGPPQVLFPICLAWPPVFHGGQDWANQGNP